MALKYAVNDTDILDNCVSWWPLNEYSNASGAVMRYDAHGSNDLIDGNTTASAAANWNRGADFERTNQEYMQITDASQSGLDFSGDSTFNLWVKPESTPSGGVAHYLYSKSGVGAGNRGYYAHYYDNGGTPTINFFVSSDGTNFYQINHAVTLSTSAYTMLTFVVDVSATDMYLYVNGSLAATQSTGPSAQWSTNGYNFRMASYTGDTTQTFDGIIQDFSVYNTALTSTQISRLYNSGDGMTYGVDWGGQSAVVNSSTQTSVSITGTNVVGFVTVAGGVGSDTITDVTWNGVSMTRINGILNPSDRYVEVYYIVNPPSGTSTIAFTGGTYWRAISYYYMGVDQTSPIDSSATNSSSSTTALSISPTVVGSNCWIGVGGKSGGGTQQGAGVLTTAMRLGNDAGALWMGDSWGTVGTGSQTATINNSSSVQMAGIAYAIAPVDEGGGVAATNNAIFSFGGF